ncbi:hypothetical protein AMJ39_02220 [candidate division TA06 bacterium DG_24]|uniref:Type II secretion system protein GspE N-terminal domain-containing protein n=1 Tax=candidate division TA06 bacterium DG_24 TaxID=1703770 RepID=A0A0S7WV26_UNCT6|nr:MAG: hypothetical protein AMJ39_02220 [candidate division TA06 bacterium DG_24]
MAIRRKLLGDILVSTGAVQVGDLTMALETQKAMRSQGVEMRIGAILLEAGHIKRHQLDEALRLQGTVA